MLFSKNKIVQKKAFARAQVLEGLRKSQPKSENDPVLNVIHYSDFDCHLINQSFCSVMVFACNLFIEG